MAYYIIIRGPAAVGKSTIAKNLAQALSAEYIAIDKVLDSHNLTSDHEEGYISQRNFLKANDLIIPETKQIIQKGKSVVIEGNFYWQSQIEDLVSRLDYKHYILTLKANLETCIVRDNSRQKGKIGTNAIKAVYSKVSEFDYGTIVNADNKVPKQIVQEILSLL